MDLTKLRAWWSHRQGLDRRLLTRTPAQILTDAGWARSMGGSGAYLSLHARGRCTRAAVDAAMANLELHELPSARGCTYVMPAEDFALALALSPVGHEAELKVALRLGVTEREIDKLCAAVLKSLAKSPLDPAQIREAAGSAARSLGEEGKKKGITTTVPLALGKLQSTGQIRRVPIGGRLDTQRYQYTLWPNSPVARTPISRDEALAQVAARYFRWIGPATLANFATFAGISGKAAKAATAHLQLEPIEPDADLLLLAADCDAFASFKPPKSPQFALVSVLDGLPLLRVDLNHLVDPADLTHNLLREPVYSQLPKKMDYLPSNAILDRGRIVGLWEYDPESQSIAWASFIPKTKDVLQAVAETEEFIRTDVDDAKTNALDSVKSRASRYAALRKCG